MLEPDADTLAELDALNGASTAHREALSESVHSIPQLVAEKSYSLDLENFKAKVRALPAVDTATLIVRLSTTTDPLLAWSIHVVLDKRDIPPCLRWPANETNAQMVFITFAADLYWFCRRNPDHIPAHRGWRGVFKHAPASSEWHATIHRQYLWITARYPAAYQVAKGLGLIDAQRQDLMIIKTNAMTAARRDLDGERFEATQQAILEHAMVNPDKSGNRRPSAVAIRRVATWRVHVLCGKKVGKTATYWTRLTGEAITRQAVAKQLAIVADVLRVRR